jgi:hypothetical protein
LACEKRIPIAEASKLLSNPEPARPPQLPRMHSTANPDQEMDDQKKEVVKLRSKIEAISVHHPQTTARFKPWKSPSRTSKRKLPP